MRLQLTFIGFLFVCGVAIGQTPIINDIELISTYPSNKVLITGSGFSPTMANLRVSFDHVNGTITASSDFSIEVTVPAQARLSNLQVTNIVSGLSAKSPMKFTPMYSGSDFVNTQVDAPLSFPATTEVFDVCSCDLDGDGKPDLVGTKQGIATDLMILRNTSPVGGGALSFVASSVNVNAPTFNLACGDLNGDGKPELVASRGGATRNEIFILRNTSPDPPTGSITFAPVTTLFMDVGQFSFRMVLRDLNLDGKPEVIVSNAFDDAANSDNIIYVFNNQSSGGTLSFNATPLKFTVSGANTTYAIDAQDLDGDKKPEIIVNPFTSSNLFVLKNISTGTIAFAPSQTITLAGTLNHMATADFNEDGKLDLAVTSSFDNKAFVVFNQSSPGTVAFAAPITLTTGTLPWGIDASDIDGDGDVDIVVGNRGAAMVDLTIFKSNGNNASLAFTATTLAAGKKSRNVRVGDFDGDGKPDFAYTTDNGNSLDIIRNKNCFLPALTNEQPITICATQTIRLNSIPGIGVTNYEWKESGTQVGTGAPSFFDITTAGSYTVTATSEAGACITTSATVVVASGAGTLPADPAISSNSPVCTSGVIMLNGPTDATITYSWTGPNGFTSTVEDPQITNVTLAHAGDYSLQVSNGTCESNISTTRVDIADLQNFVISTSVASNIICQGSNLTLSVTSQTGYTYQWIKDGADVAGQTSTTLVVTLAGAYAVRVTNTALSCSITTSTVNVSVVVPPVAGFSVSPTPTACVGQTVSFTDQSTTDANATAVYAWDFGDTGTSSSVGNASHIYTAPQTNVSPALTISYAGITGCINSLSKTMTINATPTLSITADTTAVAVGDSVQLVASGADTYAWTPVTSLSDATIANPFASPVVATEYTVTGTTLGCTGTNVITIDVFQPPSEEIIFPNVFSPNGDGINDLWVIPNIDAFMDCTLILFDTAGQKIFEQKGYKNDWGGTYKGKEVPEGTYFYIMECPDGEPFTGHVLVSR